MLWPLLALMMLIGGPVAGAAVLSERVGERTVRRAGVTGAAVLVGATAALAVELLARADPYFGDGGSRWEHARAPARRSPSR